MNNIWLSPQKWWYIMVYKRQFFFFLYLKDLNRILKEGHQCMKWLSVDTVDNDHWQRPPALRSKPQGHPCMEIVQNVHGNFFLNIFCSSTWYSAPLELLLPCRSSTSWERVRPCLRRTHCLQDDVYVWSWLWQIVNEPIKLTTNNLHAPLWGWRREPRIYYRALFIAKL